MHDHAVLIFQHLFPFFARESDNVDSEHENSDSKDFHSSATELRCGTVSMLLKLSVLQSPITYKVNDRSHDSHYLLKIYHFDAKRFLVQNAVALLQLYASVSSVPFLFRTMAEPPAVPTPASFPHISCCFLTTSLIVLLVSSPAFHPCIEQSSSSP